jgi:general secretion pathway protein K
MKPYRHRMRGAAVVMALLIVALTAAVVSGLFRQQHVLAASVQNNHSYAQSKWLMAAALDWARVILREDARNTAIDELTEPWAVPLANIRFGEESDGEPAYISGALEDAQARFNLANLYSNGAVSTREVDALKRLLGFLDLDKAVADTIAQRFKNAQPIELPNESRKEASSTQPRRVEDLIGEPGVDAAVAAKLKPFVVVLPVTTPANVNTASAEVLAARIDGLSLAQANQLVAARRQAAFKDRADVLARMPQRGGGLGSTGEPGEADISVATRFFLARGEVHYRRAELRVEALIARDQGNPAIVWQRETW